MSKTTWDFKAHFGPKLFLYWLSRRLRWESMEQKIGAKLFHWMTPYIEKQGFFWYLGQSGKNGEHEKLFYEMLDKGALLIEREAQEGIYNVPDTRKAINLQENINKRTREEN